MAAALRFNNLKIAASEQAPRICQGAMGICGIAGYENDTPYSVGRHLRDAMSGPPDDRERAHPPDERRPPAHRQGHLIHDRVPPRDRRRAELLEALVEAGLLMPSGVPGIYGRGSVFEDIRLGIEALVARVAEPDGAERSASRRSSRAATSRPSAI